MHTEEIRSLDNATVRVNPTSWTRVSSTIPYGVEGEDRERLTMPCEGEKRASKTMSSLNTEKNVIVWTSDWVCRGSVPYSNAVGM